MLSNTRLPPSYFLGSGAVSTRTVGSKFCLLKKRLFLTILLPLSPQIIPIPANYAQLHDGSLHDERRLINITVAERYYMPLPEPELVDTLNDIRPTEITDGSDIDSFFSITIG